VPGELPELILVDARAWRAWLNRHYREAAGVWLVLAKKGTTDPTSLTYDQALDDALCYGWIDGQIARRDAATYRQRFTPRRARSNWSQRNVGIVDRLIAEGRMHPAGHTEVERAKADGRWVAAYAGTASIEIPVELAAALAADPRAQAMFSVLTARNRYAMLYRIGSLRRPETRAKHVAEYVAMLARGETIYPQRRTLGD
jgi:uncharacterized protein YdeI (YjbR/CyaY-like superfamily)